MDKDKDKDKDKEEEEEEEEEEEKGKGEGKGKGKAVGTCGIGQASASSGPGPGCMPGREPCPGLGDPNISCGHGPEEQDNTLAGPPQRAPPPPPLHSPEVAAPFPTSFAHIVELITTGQPIPGIREVPDKISEEEVSESAQENKKKPWERV